MSLSFMISSSFFFRLTESKEDVSLVFFFFFFKCYLFWKPSLASLQFWPVSLAEVTDFIRSCVILLY
jgi:hypothetical protein